MRFKKEVKRYGEIQFTRREKIHFKSHHKNRLYRLGRLKGDEIMLTWTNQELDDFCEQAIELLNKKKQLQLELRNCWLFSNSSGSNLHIVFYNGFLNKEFHLCGNGRVLQENATRIDKVADLEKITDIKLKIALRIAYLIYKDCQRAMKQDK